MPFIILSFNLYESLSHLKALGTGQLEGVRVTRTDEVARNQ